MRKPSILQCEKYCYISGSERDLHLHHIYHGTGLRKISDENGFWCYLNYKYHNGSNKGVHFNRDLDLHLKRECQKKFEETHTRAEFMALIGKNYL